MTGNIWLYLKHFKREENWGDPDKMARSPNGQALLYTLDDFASYVKRNDPGRKVIIHCGVEPRGSGFHPQGSAVDLHVTGTTLWEQFESAIRFPFRGIGLYPTWNSPGLHLDMRPLASGQPRALWACREPGKYLPVTPDLF